METKVVSYEDKTGNETHRVVVGEETAIARMRRINGQTEAMALLGKSGDRDERSMRFVYVDCVAATTQWVKPENKPTYEEFAQLPAQFVDDWLSAVWEMIPVWRPNYAEQVSDEDNEKKD